ncbi:hypothetical protein NUW58_g3541 [Xylaria curta]|uniref:Uncharacterized protein n=1 Tax=Xylaria curta TaxID=42375 RepID=A0ACC1PAG6_9PEZI|nr:hypothetical protein NUW58_g3541 [Xylaria curta]
MDGVVWETNTTALEYIFNPGKVLDSFPTPQAPRMTREEAWYNASQYRGNVLIISQPEAVGMGDNFPLALSQQFTVQSDVVEDYIQTQIDISRQTEYNKWRLGVSIGLGIGLPSLVVAAALTAQALAQRRADGDVGVQNGNTLF